MIYIPRFKKRSFKIFFIFSKDKFPKLWLSNFFQNGLRLKIHTKFLKNKYNTLVPIKIASLEAKIALFIRKNL